MVLLSSRQSSTRRKLPIRKICSGSGWRHLEVELEGMIPALGLIAIGLAVVLWDSFVLTEGAIPKLPGMLGPIPMFNRLFQQFGKPKNLSPVLTLSSAGDLGGTKFQNTNGILLLKIFIATKIHATRGDFTVYRAWYLLLM